MAPKLPSPKPDAKTTISPESSFDIVEDFIPSKFLVQNPVNYLR